jgi:hypothetical protein
MKLLIQYVVGILVALLAAGAVQAKLELVEDFTGFTGHPDGQACSGVMGGTWDTQSEGTGNIGITDLTDSRVVTLIGHSQGNGRGIGFNGVTNPIENSESGIGFFRIMVRGTSRAVRTYIGMITDASDNPITSSITDTVTNITAGFGLKDNGATGMDIITIDGTVILEAGLTRDKWYNVWFVANNENDTFDLYISEAAGPDTEVTLPKPEDLIAGRIPFTIATQDPLTGMVFTNIAGTVQADRFWLDDLWWDGDQGLDKPTQARKPNPANEATDVPRDSILSWTPGPYAAKHNVYFGKNLEDVANADIGSPLLVGPGQVANTYDPERLEFGVTYYWRIDEVNAPPDMTVFKGKVWSFEAEPMAYAIAGGNIIATASSSTNENTGPEKTIDGSGLNESDQHSTVFEDMWLSDFFGAQPTWIEYEFDRVYKLHEMWVWNQNQPIELSIGYGFKDVAIEYSLDGINYTPLGGSTEFTQGTGLAGYAHNTTVDFDGAAAKYVRLTANSNWNPGGWISQYGLSEVRFYYIPVVAREPSPDSGAADVDMHATLAWRAGREAATHNLYLSTDEQAVIDGTVSAVALTDASHTSVLDLGSTYFWRIDEVNEAETPTTWQGDIWSFSTPEYLVVDDFEDYNDYPPDEIWSTWIDGYQTAANGALVGYDDASVQAGGAYVETATVRSGKQSMPLFYSNTGGATFSEAERTFAASQDWARYGIRTLVLFFHGTAGNTGQLYARINGVKVNYDGNPAAMQLFRWQQWSIDLASVGVNPASITKLAVGVDGNAAAGTLYVDDIRLYRSAPEVLVSSEEIWIEAEEATSITMPMEVREDPAASAGKYITTDESVGNVQNPPADGIATYDFTVAGGTYLISCRVKVPAGSDSFWVRIQGATIPAETTIHSSGWVMWNGMPDPGRWYWNEIFSDNAPGNATVLFTMEPGTYTLEIARREDGTQLDAIVISRID